MSSSAKKRKQPEGESSASASASSSASSSASALAAGAISNGELQNNETTDRKCCPNHCFKTVNCDFDGEIPKLKKPKEIITFLEEKNLFVPSSRKNRVHSFRISENNSLLVCSSYFAHFYGIKKASLKSAIRNMKAIQCGTTANDNARYILQKDGGSKQRYNNSDTSSLVMLADKNGVTIGDYNLLDFEIKAHTIADIRCDDKRRRANKQNIDYSRHGAQQHNNSAYAALFYSDGVSMNWVSDKPGEDTPVLFLDEQKSGESEAAEATGDGDGDVEKKKNYMNSMLSLAMKTHAIIDSYRGPDGFSRLPAPFSVDALAHAFFGDNSTANVGKVRMLCSKLRVICYDASKSPFNGHLTFYPIETNAPLCELTNIRKKKKWQENSFSDFLCDPVFHSVFNVAASFAQERLIESLTLSSSSAMIQAGATENDAWSLEVGVCETIIPQNGNADLWNGATDSTTGPTERSYALAVVYYCHNMQKHVHFVEDAHEDCSERLFIAVATAIFRFFLTFLREQQQEYEENNSAVNGIIVVHQTMVIRCAPLRDLGGELQLYAGRVLKRMCEKLGESTGMVYVVDLQWHWLPMENLGVWFAPKQVSYALDHLVNDVRYDNLTEFADKVAKRIENCKTEIITKEIVEKWVAEKPHVYGVLRSRNTVREQCNAMYARCVSRDIPVKAVAKFNASTFMVDTTQVFRVEEVNRKMRVAVKSCETMLQHIARCNPPFGKSTMIVQLCDTSGTAADGDEKSLLQRGVDAFAESYPLAEMLFNVARKETVQRVWYEWSDTSKMPGGDPQLDFFSRSYFFGNILYEERQLKGEMNNRLLKISKKTCFNYENRPLKKKRKKK